MNELISVIMSAYNESYAELERSIGSILAQTYSNIELIIVNDNPNNIELKTILNTITDERVKIFSNEKNIGLVNSLNKAVHLSKGNLIARMDADDISMPERLEVQYKYMQEKCLDMVGADIQFINEVGDVTVERFHFPTTQDQILLNIKYGNCLAHPTWLVNKEIYLDLHGYRNVKSCEDYDFVLRVLNKGIYQVGNVPIVCLQYRLRQYGISKQTEAEQYVLRDYLSKNREIIDNINEDDIGLYMESNSFKKSVMKYKNYQTLKKQFRQTRSAKYFIRIIINKYFYKVQMEKFHQKWRE